MSDKESLVGLLAGLSILSLLFKFLSPRGFVLIMAGIIYAILCPISTSTKTSR